MNRWQSEPEPEGTHNLSGSGVDCESSDDIATLSILLREEALSAYGKLPKDHSLSEFPSYFNLSKY